MTNLHQRLREAREATGITQSEVARRLKCTRSSVSQWEDGTNEPRAARLRQLALLYNVPHEWLAHGNTAGATIRDVTQLPPDEARLIKQQRRLSLWRIDSDMMAGWGLAKGHVVLVEAANTAQPRDVVIVDYETKGHLLRVFFPPYLYALPLRAQPAPLIVGGKISIIGIVRKRLSP